MYTYTFLICCIEIYVARIQTKFCLSYPAQQKRLGRPALGEYQDSNLK
jgi:hypothetical protein